MSYQFATAALARNIRPIEGGSGGKKSWIHILPSGRFTAVDGRGPWSVKSADQVIAATRAYHGRKEIVVDFEHQTIHQKNNGRPAPAAGWISALQARPDGIWAQVEWLGKAADFIANREYRYLSPVFRTDNAGSVISIMSVGLTNNPALDTLTALATAEFTPMKEDMSLSGRLSAARKLLNLPDDVSPENILDLARQLAPIVDDIQALLDGVEPGKGPKNHAAAAEPDQRKFVPIGTFERVVAELNKTRQGIDAATAEWHVEEQIRAGFLPPYLKEWGVNLCTASKPSFDDFIANTGPQVQRLFTSQLAGRGPQKTDAGRLAEDGEMIRQRLGLSVEEFTAAQLNR